MLFRARTEYLQDTALLLDHKSKRVRVCVTPLEPRKPIPLRFCIFSQTPSDTETMRLSGTVGVAMLAGAQSFVAPTRFTRNSAKLSMGTIADEMGLPCEEECALDNFPNMPASVHPGVNTGQAQLDLLNHAKENGEYFCFVSAEYYYNIRFYGGSFVIRDEKMRSLRRVHLELCRVLGTRHDQKSFCARK